MNKVCPRCREVAGVDAEWCVKCGHRYRSLPPAPVDKTHFFQPRKGANRRVPIPAVLALSLIVFSVIWAGMYSFRQIETPENPAPLTPATPAAPVAMRVRPSDLRGTDLVTGRPFIRCPFCNGATIMPHFQGGRIDRYIPCPECGGSGSVVASGPLEVVDAGEPTDYSSPSGRPIGADDPNLRPLIEQAQKAMSGPPVDPLASPGPDSFGSSPADRWGNQKQGQPIILRERVGEETRAPVRRRIPLERMEPPPSTYPQGNGGMGG